MNLTQLEYFLAAARNEHFTKAAEDIGVAQPALSRQIRHLEIELGLRLFDRVGRGVKLTDAGKTLLPRVERMLSEQANIKRDMLSLRQLEGGSVALGFLHSIGAHLLPEVLAEFRSEYPAIGFTLHEGPGQELHERVRQGNLDMAFVSPLPASENGLESIELLRDELVAAVPSNHSLASQREIHLSSLKGEPFIFLGAKFGELRNITYKACQIAGFTPRIAFEAEGLATMRGLVGAGLGVALIPEMASHVREQQIPTPVFRPLARHPAHRRIGLVCLSDRMLSPAAAAFKRMVVAHFHINLSGAQAHQIADAGTLEPHCGARRAM